MDSPSITRVLYAEDEPDLREIGQMALGDFGGFTLQICGNGREALDAAATFRPDLILLDVMMPEMDGPTAFMEMRKRPELSAVPVVFLTAKVLSTEVEQWKALGAAEVIPKPFDPMTLADTLRDIHRRHHAGGNPP